MSRPLTLAPDDADIHKHIGIMRLLLGDFAGGWPEYEWRWKTGEIKLPQARQPLWDGSSLDGKTILLTPEQGLGDTIQFMRYAAWLKERYDCRVLFHCPEALRQLLATCAGIDEWVDDTINLPPRRLRSRRWCKCRASCGTRRSDFPAKIPYLTADEALRRAVARASWRIIPAARSASRGAAARPIRPTRCGAFRWPSSRRWCG